MGSTPEMFGAGGGVRCIRATLTLARVVVTGPRLFSAAVYSSGSAPRRSRTARSYQHDDGQRRRVIFSQPRTSRSPNKTVSGNFNTGVNSPGGGLLRPAARVTITNCTFSAQRQRRGGVSIEQRDRPAEEPDDPVTGTLHLATRSSSQHGPTARAPSSRTATTSPRTAPAGSRHERPPSTPAASAPSPTTAAQRRRTRSRRGARRSTSRRVPPKTSAASSGPSTATRMGRRACDLGRSSSGCEDGLPSGTAARRPRTPASTTSATPYPHCQHASNVAPCDDGNACTPRRSLCDVVCAGATVPCHGGRDGYLRRVHHGETETGPRTRTPAPRSSKRLRSGSTPASTTCARSWRRPTADRSTSPPAAMTPSPASTANPRPASSPIRVLHGRAGDRFGHEHLRRGGRDHRGRANSGLDLLQSVAWSADGSPYTPLARRRRRRGFDPTRATGALTYQVPDGRAGDQHFELHRHWHRHRIGDQVRPRQVRALAVSADGKSVYAVSPFDDAVARFASVTSRAAPSCIGAA